MVEMQYQFHVLYLLSSSKDTKMILLRRLEIVECNKVPKPRRVEKQRVKRASQARKELLLHRYQLENPKSSTTFSNFMQSTEYRALSLFQGLGREGSASDAYWVRCCSGIGWLM